MIKTRPEILELFARRVGAWLECSPAEAGRIRERVCAALKFTGDEFRAWVKRAQSTEALAAVDLHAGDVQLPLQPGAGDERARSDWLDNEFLTLVDSAALKSGSDRTNAITALAYRIALQLRGRDAATEAYVRDHVSKRLPEIKKPVYDAMLREARVKLGHEKDPDSVAAAADGDASDWVGLARKFVSTLGDDRAILYWREKWYEWTRARGCYQEYDKTEWITGRVTLWMSEQGMATDTRSVGNLRNALAAVCPVDGSIVPPYWLPSAPDAEVKNKRVYISMENGVLDLESVQFVSDPQELDGYRVEHAAMIPHTPTFFTVNSLPYKFDAAARCPMLDEAIQKWQPVNPKTDPHGSGALILQEFAGYIFEPEQPRQVMLLNWGPGSDGKSQYKDLLIALAGIDNTVALGLEALDPQNTNGRESLVGKTLWTVPDANQIEKMGEGTLKAITGGDRVTIPRKYICAWNGVIGAKVVMSCNEFPGFRDRSEGIWRRLLLLQWNPVTGKIVPDFAKKLIESEMPGIFIWALAGWRRLREKGFSRDGLIVENVQRVRREAQHEFAFFDERIDIIEAGTEKVSNEQLMEAYVNWCRSNNIKAFAHPETLGRALVKWVRWQLERYDPPWAAEKIAEFLNRDTFNPKRNETGKPRRRIYACIKILHDDESETVGSDHVQMGRTPSAPPSFFKN